MHLSELAETLRNGITDRKHALVIMPAFREYDRIKKHLYYLSRQQSHDFDLVIVLNALSDETQALSIIDRATKEMKCGFGIAVLKRKEDSGSAGGFFTGQKYALEKNYAYQIFADADCYPTDPNLVGALISSGEHDYVSHPVENTVNGKILVTTPITVLAQYCLLSSRIVRKTGLYYLPLYMDSDDLEYMERLGRKPYVVPNLATHPIPYVGLRNLDRYLRSLTNALAISRSIRALVTAFLTIVALLSTLAIFSPPYGKKAHKAALRCLLTHAYGKHAVPLLRTNFMDYASDEPADYSSPKPIRLGSAFGQDASGIMPYRVLREIFRKRMLIEEVSSITLTLLTVVFSKKSYIRLDDGKLLLLCDNTNLAFHALKLVALCIYLPVLAVFMFITLSPLKLLLQPKTTGYGLD